MNLAANVSVLNLTKAEGGEECKAVFLNLPPAKGQDEEPAAFCASLLAACSKV